MCVFVWGGGGGGEKKKKKKHALIFLKTMQYAVFPEFICGQSVRGHTCKDLLVRQCLDDGDIIAIIHGKFFNFFWRPLKTLYFYEGVFLIFSK